LLFVVTLKNLAILYGCAANYLIFLRRTSDTDNAYEGQMAVSFFVVLYGFLKLFKYLCILVGFVLLLVTKKFSLYMGEQASVFGLVCQFDPFILELLVEVGGRMVGFLVRACRPVYVCHGFSPEKGELVGSNALPMD
jgi:hypothetical protein